MLTAASASAQVTTGSIFGRITDPNGGVLPGVAVTVVNVETGFERSDVTDGTGTYRLAALPRGTYSVKSLLSGFMPTESEIPLGVTANVQHDIKLQLAKQNEVLVVTANAPRATSHVVGSPMERGLQLPMDGRNVMNLVQLEPGVGGGGTFHSDSSRATQPVAQVGGNNGRSTNVLLDGGDNNDDTVGGMSQPIPLSAIAEYKLFQQRFDAQFGRGNSALNIITKSGTNQTRGGWFTFMRDDALNAQTFTEKKANVEKQPYGRYQYGGDLGGPVVKNNAHYFVAYERTQQDTKQVVNTSNTLPGDGIYDVPFRQDLFSGKLTLAPNPKHYVAIRYARDHETQPSGVTPSTAYSAWAESTNSYNSLNVNHNWQTGKTSVNEFVFQYSSYLNDTPANAAGPAYTLPSGAKGGANANAPQTTEQQRWQFRNDYSWNNQLLGTTHEFRTGVNWLHTPQLFISNRGMTDGLLTLRSNDINGGVNSIMLIGGTVESNIPTDLYGVYAQDDWRVSSKLTVNLGVRYDYLDGIPTNQTSTNFQQMQLAGQAGAFAGTFLEDFGKTPKNDSNNIQPRFGAVYDLRGDGRDLIRGGWGIYTEQAYTNANVLTSTLEGGGIIYQGDCLTTSAPSPNCDPSRGFVYGPSLNPTLNQLYTAASGVSAADIGLPVTTPTTGEVVSPRLQQPFSYQTNAGWSHDFGRGTLLTVDYVKVQGRDINMRIRPNVDINPDPLVTQRYLNSLGVVGILPNSQAFRTAVSAGRSEYNALIMDVRKATKKFDVDASYTLSKSLSDVGTAADELAQNLLQDPRDPFSEFQLGPSTRVDARHRVTASGIYRAPYEFQVAGTLMFRTALPVTTLQNQDRNLDGTATTDQTLTAFRYAGMTSNGAAWVEETGACLTVNCSRRASFSQVNLRVSRGFSVGRTARVEAMVEIFNVFNAKNPFIPVTTNYTSGNVASGSFMQPTAFAGDAGQGEQRMAQLGARITF